MKKTRKELAAAFIEISLILILSVALIVMFAAYCKLRNSSQYSELPEFDFRNETSSGAEITDENATLGLLSPNFVGIVTDKMLAPADIASRNKLLSDIKPFLLSVFSDVSTLIEFSDNTARKDYIARNLYYAKDYIYLEFSREIPASAIVPAITGKTLGSVYHAFNVKDLFIFCDSSGAISGAAIDENGNVATLTVRDRTSLSFETLRAYENAGGMKKFEFGVFEDKKYPLYTTSVSRNNLSAYNNSGDFLSSGAQDAKNILSAFSLNSNTTRFYRTGNNAITFVEDNGELKITSAGDITYTSSGSGIPLSSLCVSQNEMFSFEDRISAAYNIISRLDRSYFGDAAYLALTSVTYDQKTFEMTLEFSYCYGGVYISSRNNYVARFVFDKDSLVFADVSAKTFSISENTFTDIPQRLLFLFSTADFDKQNPPLAFTPVYKQDTDTAEYNAKYAFVYTSAIAAGNVNPGEVAQK